MAKGKYETAMMTLVPADPKEWQPAHIELLSSANAIDYATDNIIRDSKSLAKKFASFAEDMELRGSGWTPMGSSTFRDIEISTAQLDVHKSYLANLLRMTFGKNGYKNFMNVLESK